MSLLLVIVTITAAQEFSTQEKDMNAIPDTPATSADQIKLRNRLGEENSPYLLQHKNNPVHWWAWGEEAFAAARALDRPIFLSIGYSTCYWCHVMERESFENEETAAILNEHFICIKVDREERPDVDQIYMTAVQMLNQGHGGWPMSVWLEPENLQPFLAGTYFPPEDGYGRPGFPSVLRQIIEYWQNQHDPLLQQAAYITEQIRRHYSTPVEPQPLDQTNIERAITGLLSEYDAEEGGFNSSPSRAPKFPMPANLDFLMQAAWDRSAVKKAVLHTLDQMALGGMYDQIGGGFHRYSTDRQWLVPHFEKMLYDNGQLATTYAKAYELTRDEYYAEILRETLDYVLREMHDQQSGAFYSAQDAEVNHREGQSYLWKEAEVRTVLEDNGLADDIDFALKAYGFDQGVNFQDPHHHNDPPCNVVYLINRPKEIAIEFNLDTDTFNQKLRRINEVLLSVRDQRDQPLTDDKILTGWNGLMIAGLADGGRVLNDDKYITAAKGAVDFIINTLRTDDGELLRTWRQGTAKIDAFLEDYAYFIQGLLALHRATNGDKLLQIADELNDQVSQRFGDVVQAGYFDALAGQTDLFVRAKTLYDGATPSGNSVMLHNLLDLYELTENEKYLNQAQRQLDFLSPYIVEQPHASIVAVAGFDRFPAPTPPHRTSTTSSVPTESSQTSPVSLTTSTDALYFAPRQQHTLNITITIDAGYHINAHQPGLENLIPLELVLIDGEGLSLLVDYPAGVAINGPLGEMSLHEGQITLPVILQRTGDIVGQPQLMLTYQVCTEQACLQPETIPVPLMITAK